MTKDIGNLHLEEKSSNSEEEILTENINMTDRKISSPLSDDYQLLVSMLLQRDEFSGNRDIISPSGTRDYLRLPMARNRHGLAVPRK